MRKCVTLKDIPIGKECYLNENDLKSVKVLSRNVLSNLVQVGTNPNIYAFEWTPAYIEV